MSVEVGKIVEGKVSGLTNFGAFVQLPNGKVGLVHISEVAEEYIKDIKSHLNEDQTVMVKIISIEKSGKIGLSIKKALAPKSTTETTGTSENASDVEKKSTFQKRNSFEKKPPFDKRNSFDKKGKYQKRGNTVDAPPTFEDKISNFMKDSDERMLDLKRSFESKRGSGGYRRY